MSAVNFTDYLAPLTRMRFAAERLASVGAALERSDYLAALRQADSFAGIFSDMLADVAQAAYADGHSKAAIARALGVSPAAFRGMVRS